MKRLAMAFAILLMTLTVSLFAGQSAFALDRPYTYVSKTDSQREYDADTETAYIHDNGESVNKDINILPIDKVDCIRWFYQSDAIKYRVSIRDVDQDVQIYNEYCDADDCSLDLFMSNPNNYSRSLLSYGTNYKIAVGAYENEESSLWSTPLYFRLTQPVVIEGEFYDGSITLTQGDTALVSGEVTSSGSPLSRITYQIDGFVGWGGDNNRYRSQEVSDVYFVSLDRMSDLVLDTNSEPLNIPGTYTLRLLASTADGSWEKLDWMNVTVVDDQGTQFIPEDPIPDSPTEAPQHEPEVMLWGGLLILLF